ncbi:MAG TPA: copper oxidase [Kofleriaceae bacterium]|nr:copper oxidase [Kofleriaceae bacterium]
MSISRRNLLAAGAALAAAGKLVKHVDAAPAPSTGPRGRVHVPNGSSLESKSRGGVKIFHLRAQAIRHEIAPGLTIEAWGYNGATPGPLIEVDEGDRVRVYVTNELPEPTSVHWHGVFVPAGMDGVAGLTQAPIAPGKTFKYEFVFDRAGTFMYHPHADEMTQIALGMMGMIVVHPRSGEARRVRDYALMTHEMTVPIGARRPEPLAMNDFNVLTFNGKSFPATEPLVAETGDLVRIRLANLGPMDHHPIHLHGHAFEVVATDGGIVPHSARFPETTVLVPTGTVRVIEFIARAPGDWALHCHMTHHAMNQMGHAAANLVGVEISGIDDKLGRVVPGYMTMGANGMSEMGAMAQPVNSIAMMGAKGPHGTIDMGGMFTILKIRDSLATDPGWYAAPQLASEASADELHRDGIE